MNKSKKMIDATLVVFLKDSDLVATTSFLTLTSKMGYKGKLLGLKRFDYFRFEIEYDGTENPEEIINTLAGVLSSQSTFYNRNKHHYLLECKWDGKLRKFGTELAVARKGLRRDVFKSLKREENADLSVHSDPKKVILKHDSVFSAEFLVQETENSERRSLAIKLSGDLTGRCVEFKDKGVLWWLALGAQDEGEAGFLAKEIAVTVRRDKGLLLNPNYQDYRLVGIRQMILD